MGRGPPDQHSRPGRGPRRSCFPLPQLWPCLCGSKAGPGLSTRAQEEPPDLLHPGPSPEALASSLRAALCPSSPPPPRRNAAKEPFSRQKKKKKNRPNEIFSSRQEQGDEIHNSRETGLGWPPSSLSAGMEPQSLARNSRRTVCATWTRGRSPRAGGDCCPAGCVSEAPAGDSRDQGTPGPPGWAFLSARTSFRPEQGSAVDIQPRVGMPGVLPLPAWGPEVRAMRPPSSRGSLQLRPRVLAASCGSSPR